MINILYKPSFCCKKITFEELSGALDSFKDNKMDSVALYLFMCALMISYSETTALSIHSEDFAAAKTIGPLLIGQETEHLNKIIEEPNYFDHVLERSDQSNHLVKKLQMKRVRRGLGYRTYCIHKLRPVCKMFTIMGQTKQYCVMKKALHCTALDK